MSSLKNHRCCCECGKNVGDYFYNKYCIEGTVNGVVCRDCIEDYEKQQIARCVSGKHIVSRCGKYCVNIFCNCIIFNKK
jgi:hypothetical protein